MRKYLEKADEVQEYVIWSSEQLSDVISQNAYKKPGGEQHIALQLAGTRSEKEFSRALVRSVSDTSE